MANAEPGRLHFLDGIRGWAALAVVLYHLLPTFLVTPQEQAGARWLFVPIDGSLAVYVFFVVSGFSLSIGFLRSKEKRVLLILAARRYPRLAIPVFASCVVTFAMLSAGANFAPEAARILGRTNWPATSFQFQAHLPSMVKFALFDVFFSRSAFPSYNPVLWTMHIEMVGSFVVFALLAAVGAYRVRFGAYALTWAFFAYEESPLSAFIAGVAVAEMFDSGWLQRLRTSGFARPTSFSLIAATYLLCCFNVNVHASPTALSLLSTALLVSVVCNQSLLTAMQTPTSRFLGSISFPLYLTHVVVICTLGALAAVTMYEARVPGEIAAALVTIIVIPASILTARAFLPIEEFSISVSRRLANSLSMRRKSEAGPSND